MLQAMELGGGGSTAVLGGLPLLFNGRIPLFPAHQFKCCVAQTIHYKRELNKQLPSFSTIIVLFPGNLFFATL